MSLLLLLRSAGAASTQANAGVAAGTGAANAASASLQPNANVGTGSGSAGGSTSSVKPTAQSSSGTGAAHNPTISTAAFVTANAGVASGAGAASNATLSIKPNSGAGAGSGSAGSPGSSIAITSGAAVGSGTAYTASVPVPVWTTPADTVAMIASPELKFTTPLVIGGDMHFNIWLDTDVGFGSGDFRSVSSDLDQTGWDYWNGSAWTPVPAGGVPLAFAGNEIRYTIQTPLTGGTWYRKVRVGT